MFATLNFIVKYLILHLLRYFPYMGKIHMFEFKGKPFKVLECNDFPGCPNPSIFTFQDEASVREKFWNIKPKEVVLDVGAAFGSYTLTACALGGIVYPFEPRRDVYKALVENLKINGFLGKTAFPLNVALWDEEATISEKSYAPHSKVEEFFTATTMDKVVEELKIKVNWVKIDVDGAELNVIKGGTKTIAKFKPKMLIECHQFIRNFVPEVEGLLRSLYEGYRFVEEPYHAVVHVFAAPMEGEKR
jgi:FkbM family methyltransferase